MAKIVNNPDNRSSKSPRQRNRTGVFSTPETRISSASCRPGCGVERAPERIKYRELLQAVLRGTRASTCPVAFWRHHPIADQDTDTMVAATLEFQKRHDCDFVKVTPASTFQLRDYGLADAWRGDSLGRRWIGPGIMSRPEDWAALLRLNPNEGFLGRHVACARRLRRQLDPAIPVIQTVFNPMFQALCLAGESFQEHCTSAPDAVAEGMDILGHNTALLVQALADAGVDGIYLVAQNARAGAMSAAEYVRISRGTDQACLEAARSMPFNFLHLHGDSIHLAALPSGTDCVLHFSEGRGNPDASSLLCEHGHCVSTGPDPMGRIRLGTPTEAFEEAAQVLNRLKGPGFILSAGCVVTLDTPGENIDAAIRAARTPRPDRH